MRILHIISNLMSGGAESMMTKVIEALPGHEHVVVSFIDGGLFAERLQKQGVRVIGLGCRQGRAWQAAFRLGDLKRIVRETAPDVVQGWMYHGNLAASAAAQGRPALWNVRQRLESLADNSLMTRGVILGSLAWRDSVAAVIYNSAKAAAEHEAWGYPADKRVLIPNGFDLSAFAPDATAGSSLRGELGLPPDALLLGRVARNDAIKDTPTLIAAMAAVTAGNAHLVLVGRGMTAENADLSALIQRHGLAGRVHPLGERSDIPRLNAAFDVALLSSSHGEGFPNVVCEAMAAGTPVVATDVGECREIIDDPARIAPPRDPAALAATVDRVLALAAEERIALGARDRARVAAHFALPAVAEQYAALWQRLAGPR